MNKPRHIISRYSQWLAVLSLVLFNVVGTLAQAQSSRWTPTIIATGDCASGYSVTVYDTACDSYMWKGGTEYESSPAGGITRTFITDDDCDSTVTLYLKMNHTSQIPRTAEACDSFVWTSDSTIKVSPQTTGSHTYTMVIGVNEDGCDLAEMLTLNLKSSTSRTLSEVNECDTFIWRAAGQTFTTTNLNAFYTGLNAQGCNDTVRRRIIIRHSTEAPVQNETHCIQYTWPWNSTTYKLSQPTEDLTLTERATIPNSNAVGCDSTRTLHLFLHHADTLYTDEDVCDSYHWDYNNQDYTETKRDTFSIFNSYGCDSTMILNLIVRYSSTETLTETKAGDRFPGKGVTIKQPPNVKDLKQAAKAEVIDQKLEGHLDVLQKIQDLKVEDRKAYQTRKKNISDLKKRLMSIGGGSNWREDAQKAKYWISAVSSTEPKGKSR